MIENLTEKELHQIINHIRHEFQDYVVLDKDQLDGLRSILASHCCSEYWLENKHNYPTINSMKDNEILMTILDNKILCVHPTIGIHILPEDYINALLKVIAPCLLEGSNNA